MVQLIDRFNALRQGDRRRTRTRPPALRGPARHPVAAAPGPGLQELVERRAAPDRAGLRQGRGEVRRADPAGSPEEVSMPGKRRGPDDAPLRRSCGTMAVAHDAAGEAPVVPRPPVPAGAGLRPPAIGGREPRQAQGGHGRRRRQRGLQDRRAEHLRRAGSKPDRRAQPRLRRQEPGQVQGADALEGAGDRLAHPVQAPGDHPHQDDEGVLHVRRRVKQASTGGIAPKDPAK